MLIKSPECLRKTPTTNEKEKRELFLVRHVDEKLINRTPSGESGSPTVLDRGYTMARTVTKSPWHRDTSRMDTVASLLHRKCKIYQPPAVRFEFI